MRYVRFFLLSLLLLPVGHGFARTVKSVKIDEIGMNSNKDENAARACKKFRPKKDQIVRFFNRAYPVEAYQMTTIRYSSCYASGSLEFSDGSFGTWDLFSSGVARFTFNRGDIVFLFNKPNRWHDPYACSYGLGQEPEC